MMDQPVKLYVNRRSDIVVLNNSFDREAVEVLHRYCPPGRKSTGRFLSRLILEFHARQEGRAEERKRLRQLLTEDNDALALSQEGKD